MKCIPDVYCPKKVEKRHHTKHSAKDLKFYICEGILADIFYSSGSTHDLYAQLTSVQKCKPLYVQILNTLCTDIMYRY
jgi:hypothetical protein